MTDESTIADLITTESSQIWIVGGAKFLNQRKALRYMMEIVLRHPESVNDTLDNLCNKTKRDNIRGVLDMMDEYDVMEKLKTRELESCDRTEIR